MIKISLIIISSYLLLFYALQFINPSLSWYQQSLIVGFTILLATFKSLTGTVSRRLALGLISIFIAFIVSFIYSNLAVWRAQSLCRAYIDKKIEAEKIKNKLEANGLPTVVNLIDQCASEYLPFPWFSKPKN